MNTNAALKQQQIEMQDYHFQPNMNRHAEGTNVESLAEHRARIAQQAEAAVHVRGNINGPDLDWFEVRYGTRSNFA